MTTLRMLFHHPKMTKPENNFTPAGEPGSGSMIPNRRGFYFVINSKLSRLFDVWHFERRNGSTADHQRKKSKPELTALKSPSYVKLGQATF